MSLDFNIPRHPYYQRVNHVKHAKRCMSRTLIDTECAGMACFEDGVVGGFITVADGAEANLVLPSWVEMQATLISGNAVEQIDNTIKFLLPGPYILEAKATVEHNYGRNIIFGRSINGGPIEEWARAQVNSDDPLFVFTRREVNFQPDDTVTLYISSDFEWDTFSWTGMDIILYQRGVL